MEEAVGGAVHVNSVIRQEFETSFDEYSAGESAKRFIALEVSDNEDDYNSSVDSLHAVSKVSTNTVLGPLADNGTENRDLDIPESISTVTQSYYGSGNNNGSMTGNSSALGPASVSVGNSSNSNNNNNNNSNNNNTNNNSNNNPSLRPVKDEKKRWSFISANSSNKKRWSTLSFVSDTKSNKRLSIVSSDSSSKRSSVQSLSQQSSSNKLKRSSTGASLRSMFNKIALKDEDKENTNTILHHKRVQSTTIASTVNITAQAQMNPPANTNRIPLSQINQNTRREQRFSTIPASPSMDNMSMFSQQSNASMGSKWKFWKRRAGDFPQDSRYMQDPNTSSSSTTTTSMRTKTSLSDLRKSIFQNSILGTDPNSQDLKSRRSHSSLHHKTSQSSLKQKTSHPSLKKLQSSRRNSSIASNDSSPQISLPIPDQVSRDKIRTKLRHSSSLISINSNVVGGSVIIAETDEYDESVLQQILDLCTVKEIVSFDYSPTLRQLDHYIYIDSSNSTIYKIVPLDNDDRECKMTRQMRLQELQLTMLLNGTPGFTNVLDVKLVRRDNDQALFLVYHMKNHGKSLNQLIASEHRQFTVAEIKDIITQCIRILYVAETKFQFEHRLLTLDHVLLDSNKNVTLIDYKLSRATYGSQVLFTRLDHPLFFEFRKDYNSILQWLRQSMTVDSWSLFYPKTNLVWLNYIISKLLQHCKDPQTNSPLLNKIQASLESTKSRKLWKRHDGVVESCADIVSYL